MNDATDQQSLAKATKNFQIDLQAVMKILANLRTEEEKERYLGYKCPSLYIFLLKKGRAKDKLAAYTEYCKSKKYDP